MMKHLVVFKHDKTDTDKPELAKLKNKKWSENRVCYVRKLTGCFKKGDKNDRKIIEKIK